MNPLIIVMILFIILETLNVVTLYFQPGSTKGNGIGIFKAWEKSKEDEDVHKLVKYLVNWVAGTKLIFIALIIVIILTGSETTQMYAVIAMIVSILSFFWRLFPSIKLMDHKDQIIPKGYSTTLAYMIGSIVSLLFIGLVAYLL